MAKLLNICRFTAGSSGTVSFTDGAGLQGYLNLSGAGAVNGIKYSYRAENVQRTEWEDGTGIYNSGAGTLSRTVERSSNSDLVVNFTAPPIVFITAYADDIQPPFQANIMDYGAVGDGSTDDTAAINRAIVEVNGNGGGIVIIPARTFIVTDGIEMLSNVWLRGCGLPSVIKSVALASGGSPEGHRQVRVDTKTKWSITDLTFDASAMTSWTAGMRNIWAHDCTHYAIERCDFKTPGAAVASVGCSDFTIRDNTVTVSSTDGTAKHDGVIDQWGGCHDFRVVQNEIHGADIGRYGILVTGQDTDLSPTANYDFEISGNRIYNFKYLGIWLNGRDGLNADFTCHHNLVNGVTDYFGIALADCARFSLDFNNVALTALNGIRLYSETANGGTYGCRYGSIVGNVVRSSNEGLASGDDGAAILFESPSQFISVAGNVVLGANHTYAVRCKASTTAIHVAADNALTAGTTAGVSDAALNNIYDSSTYTPTHTAVANVTASTAYVCRWKRVNNFVQVTGRLDVQPTAAATTDTRLGISLPIASGFTDITVDCAGIGCSPFGVIGSIAADVTNDRAEFRFPSPNTVNNVVYFQFEYTLK